MSDIGFYGATPTTDLLTIARPDGTLLLRIGWDGTVEGDVADASEAARVFCREVAGHFGLPRVHAGTLADPCPPVGETRVQQV